MYPNPKYPSLQAINLLQQKLQGESIRADAAEACLKAAAHLTATATPLKKKVVSPVLLGIAGDAIALLQNCVCGRVCAAAARRDLCPDESIACFLSTLREITPMWLA